LVLIHQDLTNLEDVSVPTQHKLMEIKTALGITQYTKPSTELSHCSAYTDILLIRKMLRLQRAIKMALKEREIMPSLHAKKE